MNSLYLFDSYKLRKNSCFSVEYFDSFSSSLKAFFNAFKGEVIFGFGFGFLLKDFICLSVKLSSSKSEGSSSYILVNFIKFSFLLLK